ncbi:MAG TPA: glycosyltransferase, partial [Thiobacillus sp.]|nr:glycosyltransferase [Thiobacillus sp.]
GIPTRNREPMLGKTLKALLGQSLPPSLVIIVDNNDKPNTGKDKVGDTEFIRVPCDFRMPGPEQGHQTVLRHAARRGFGVAVRWDDDLVPEKQTMEALVRRIGVDKCVGAGGMYPKPGEARKSGPQGSGDGNPRHLQFFAWDHEPGGYPVIERKHLYSSFAYSVSAALLAGGFCVEYSRFGQRGETDFSLRLAREGRLVVDTAALAWHHWAPGGRRMDDEEMIALSAMDEDLFVRRMIAYGIDQKAW